jgi:predicted PurR-regulated permease PerM
MKGILIIITSVFFVTATVVIWGLVQQGQILEEERKQTDYRERLLEQEKETTFYFQQANKKIDTLISLRRDEK